MAVKRFNYKQLDGVLSELGFRKRQTKDPKGRTWLYYEHGDTETEIILIEKKPTELVRVTDALSARRHLIEKGLVSEEELDTMLSGKQTRKKV